MFEYIREISFLVIGAVLGIAGKILLNKILSKKPAIKWRILPPVTFDSQGLTAVTISIANDGDQAAEELRILVTLPNDATIENCEVVNSERAIKFSEQQTKNQKELHYPYFNSGLECTIAFLAKGLKITDIDNIISIVAKDAKGQKIEAVTAETKSKWERKQRRSLIGFLILYIFGLLLSVGYILGERMNDDYYLSTMDTAQLYMEVGRYEWAIERYKKLISFFKEQYPRPYYKLAVAYAAQNDTINSVHYLKELHNKDAKLFEFAIYHDDTFDLIRSSKPFSELIETTKRTNKQKGSN